jgi:hypothetical protein
MGVVSVIARFDSRRVAEIVSGWAMGRGWSQTDLDRLQRKFDEPSYYSGGIIKITIREHRAWCALNGRLLAEDPKMIRSPSLALQLPFCFEVGSLGDRLMSSTPE